MKNMDDLNRLHKKALVGRAGSRAWIEFATTMVDSFPALYQTAQRVNERLAETHEALALCLDHFESGAETENEAYLAVKRVLTPK